MCTSIKAQVKPGHKQWRRYIVEMTSAANVTKALATTTGGTPGRQGALCSETQALQGRAVLIDCKWTKDMGPVAERNSLRLGFTPKVSRVG